MASEAKKKAITASLVVGAIAMTGYGLYKSIVESENKKKIAQKRIRELYGTVKKAHVEYLQLWVDAPTQSLPPILQTENAQADKLLEPFLETPESIKGLSRKEIRNLAQEGFPLHERKRIWLHILGIQNVRHFVIKYYSLLPRFKGIWEKREEDTSDLHMKLRHLDKDLHRTNLHATTGMQDVLRNMLGVYAIADSEIGYVQGMNMIGFQILNVMEHDALGFAMLCQLFRLNNQGVKLPRVMEDVKQRDPNLPTHAYCAGGSNSKTAVEGYGMRFMFTNCLPGTIISMLILDHLISEKLPEVRETLRADPRQEIAPQMFASEWFFTLFAYVIKDDQVLHRVWDMIICDGYKAIFRVSLAILKQSHAFIEDQEFSTKVHFLKNFTDDFFAHDIEEKPGDNLIKLASGFKVTNQYLSHLATNILEEALLQEA